jgi:SAM-dependent methyltransferase
MGCFSPGGTELMTGAVRALGLASGSRVLDIGCGEGDALARIADEFGYACAGVDKSEELIRAGLAKRSDLDLRVGDARALKDLSRSFPDGFFHVVMLECTLSVSGSPADALREAARVTAPGGYMLISDLCNREEAAAAHENATGRQAGDDDEPIAPGGHVSIDALSNFLRSEGFELVSFENRTRDLDSFAAERIFEYGSLEAYYESVTPGDSERCDLFPVAPATEAPTKDKPRPPGYFLSTFRKQITAIPPATNGGSKAPG